MNSGLGFFIVFVLVTPGAWSYCKSVIRSCWMGRTYGDTDSVDEGIRVRNHSEATGAHSESSLNTPFSQFDEFRRPSGFRMGSSPAASTPEIVNHALWRDYDTLDENELDEAIDEATRLVRVASGDQGL
jgi:hypothetical protein